MHTIDLQKVAQAGRISIPDISLTPYTTSRTAEAAVAVANMTIPTSEVGRKKEKSSS
jgi:hypothetical protein